MNPRQVIGRGFFMRLKFVNFSIESFKLVKLKI